MLIERQVFAILSAVEDERWGSYVEIRDMVREEAESVRSAVDSRCEAIERKLEPRVQALPPNRDGHAEAARRHGSGES